VHRIRFKTAQCTDDLFGSSPPSFASNLFSGQSPDRGALTNRDSNLAAAANEPTFVAYQNHKQERIAEAQVAVTQDQQERAKKLWRMDEDTGRALGWPDWIIQRWDALLGHTRCVFSGGNLRTFRQIDTNTVIANVRVLAIAYAQGTVFKSVFT